jgi:hypothetical protein
MYTFLAFVVGTIAGVALLTPVIIFLAKRVREEKYKEVTVRWDQFYSEGQNEDPSLGESRYPSIPEENKSEEALNRMLEREIWAINKISRVRMHPPNRHEISDPMTRIHEAGHAVMLLRCAPMQLYYGVVGGHADALGRPFAGFVRHGRTNDYAIGLISYGGHAAELVFNGRSNSVLTGADLRSAFAHAYFHYWDQRTPKQKITQPIPLHPWAALGVIGKDHEDPEAMKATLELCEKMCEEAVQIISKEREAVQAIADAFKEKPILRREEMFAIWEKFHPGAIAKAREARWPKHKS